MHIQQLFLQRKRLILTLIIPAALILTGIGILALQQTTPWTKADAEILAKRTLLDPTPDDITRLASAHSRQEAVTMLFTPPSSDGEQRYQQGLQNLENTKSTYKNDIQYENIYYTYQLIHDPDRIRRKLYYLLENIFPVDASEKDDGITYKDVQNLDNLLYTNALGNYLTIAKSMQTNYAMAVYLNLPDSNPTNPNENFARELMQLFLMGPYTPLDTNQTHPNYSEQDVNALAYILTGYHTNKGNHTIFYDPQDHYTGSKTFLGDTFNDPSHVVDYIESKKKTEMSEFLANKLLKYYVSDTPTNNDIVSFANVIAQNNFDMLPSLKWLFTSDIMYRPDYIQEARFKTPVELVASLYTDLYGRNNYTVIPSPTVLADLDFDPYLPGSVFGRDGFNKNSLFYSGTIINRWIADSDILVHQRAKQGQATIATHFFPNGVAAQTSTSIISQLENTMYLGTSLPQAVTQTLTAYVEPKQIKNTRTKQTVETQNTKLLGLIALMAAQPEFITQSGSTTDSPMQTFTGASDTSLPDLLVVRIKGGWDYQNLVANTSDPKYLTDRKLMPLTSANSTSIGNGYMLNNAANALFPLLHSHEVSFVSAVGLPNHSRAHDIASVQMETGLNQTGILANAYQHDSNLSLISFTGTPPVMFRGTQGLQIGSTNLLLYRGTTGDTKLREQTITNIFKQRNFPAKLSVYYEQALLLYSLTRNNVTQSAQKQPMEQNNKNAEQLSFLGKLMEQNIGNVYYLAADNSYDHHAHEDEKFNKQVSTLFNDLTAFYNGEKTKKKLTIIVFSEFGRTDKINGSHGTDHGTGGGMVILSNTMQLPTMIGSLTPSTDTNNWTNVKVDARDVWSTIFNNLYNIPVQTLFGRTTTLTSYPVAIH